MSQQKEQEFSGHLVACYDCDFLVRIPENIPDSQRLHCPRCHHHITSGEHRSDQYLAALSLTAMIVFIVANSFDFLVFAAQGQEVSISLAASSVVLWERDFLVLGALVLAFIVLLPAVYLCGLLLLLLPRRWSHNSRRSIFLGRVMSALLPWAMADVFLIGVLVALIKIVSIADIVFGLAFWAYIVFTGIFLHITVTVDRMRLWRLVDRQRGVLHSHQQPRADVRNVHV